MARDSSTHQPSSGASAARAALACGAAALIGVASIAAQGGGQARAPQNAASGDVHVEQIRNNVYLLAGGGGNVVVQIEPPKTDENHLAPYLEPRVGVLLVDTGRASMGDKIVATVRQLSKGQIRYVINTSADPLHVGGNEAVVKAFVPSGPPRQGGGPAGENVGGEGNAAAGPAIFAQEAVLDRISSATGKDAVPMAAWPTSAFETDKAIVFNGESIQIIHVPEAHTDGDSIVFLRRSDVLVAGDIFSTESYPQIDAEHGGSVHGVINGLNQLLDLAIPGDRVEDGTVIVPGHGRLCDYADMNEYRNAVVIIRDRVQDLVNKGRTLEQVKAARPSQEYDRRYSTPASTADMFVTAVYNDLSDKSKRK